MSSARRIGILSALASIALGAVCAAAQSKSVDASREPPLGYTLKIGERSVAILEGETVRLKGTFTDPEITLSAESHCVFPYGGVSFRYPRSFAFEARVDDPVVQSWTLSGNDFKIMYLVFAGQLTTEDFAASMMGQFDRGSCKISKTEEKLGSDRIKGARLRVTIASHDLLVDIYRVPSEGSGTGFLVLQDSPDDAGNRSGEAIEAMKLLTSSFEREGKP